VTRVHIPPRGRTLVSIALVALSAASCASAALRTPALTPPSASALRASISDRLYFGRSIPQGGTVSPADWTAFLRDVVTPRFPAGLTSWQAAGQWRDESGAIVREESFVLELIHPADARADTAILEIIADYRRRFQQESVLRVRDRVEVTF
jgi:hypothetical protein